MPLLKFQPSYMYLDERFRKYIPKFRRNLLHPSLRHSINSNWSILKIGITSFSESLTSTHWPVHHKLQKLETITTTIKPLNVKKATYRQKILFKIFPPKVLVQWSTRLLRNGKNALMFSRDLLIFHDIIPAVLYWTKLNVSSEYQNIKK